jgi:hypothetical protein
VLPGDLLARFAAPFARLGLPYMSTDRMLRKPVFCERIGAVVDITGGFAAKSGRVGGLTASVGRLLRCFRGA